MRRSSFECRVVLVVIVVLSWFAPMKASCQTLDINSQVRLNIPAQSLETSLLELSRQGAFQLVISAATVPPRMAPAITGSMSIKAALEQLLRDTDLDFKRVGEHTLVVTRRSNVVPASDSGASANGVSGSSAPLESDSAPHARGQSWGRGL